MRARHEAPGRGGLRRRDRAVTLALLAAAAAAALGGCAPDASKMTARPVSEVLKSHAAELMAIPGVVGTGEGASGGAGGGPVILVLVSRPTPEITSRVPKRLEGYPVQIRVVGEVRKLGRE